MRRGEDEARRRKEEYENLRANGWANQYDCRPCDSISFPFNHHKAVDRL